MVDSQTRRLEQESAQVAETSAPKSQALMGLSGKVAVRLSPMSWSDLVTADTPISSG